MPELTLEELEQEAQAWFQRIGRGGVLWLSGELGSGKTTFVQAIARAASATPARSPTFALVHEYPTPEGPLIHVDCYRLKRPAEALDLDFPDLAARARLLAIEWPERAGRFAPAPDVHLCFRLAGDPARRGLERVA